MTRKFKNGQRVQIIKGYGKPVGEIVKYSKTLDTYNIQGDDGYSYNCVAPEDIVLLDGITLLKEDSSNVFSNGGFINASDIYYTSKEAENTISVHGDILKAGDELSSLLLNGKEIENVEEVKVALNMVVKALNRMVN